MQRNISKTTSLLLTTGTEHNYNNDIAQTFITADLDSVNDWNLLVAKAAECADV